MPSLSSDLSGLGAGATNLLGAAAAYALAQTGPFRTKPTTTPPALFSLAICQAAEPYLPYFIYTFPLSPSDLKKDITGMANVYDVAGPSANFGVSRIADVYGASLPTFTIAGTTGVKYHSTDRFFFTGLESIQTLQNCILQYFGMVAEAGGSAASSNKLPRLEFYNYFASEFYQIVPIGPQGISQSNQRPQLLNYQFKWAAIQNLLQPLTSAIDTALSPLTGEIGKGISVLSGDITSAFSSYPAVAP